MLSLSLSATSPPREATTMVTLQLLQKPSLNSIFSVSHYHQCHHHSPQLPSFRLKIPRASATQKSRRQIITETATATAITLVSGLSLSVQKGIAAEDLSEWERVYLPIDPGVVLLDISFVPDDPNHGAFYSSFLLSWSILHTYSNFWSINFFW